MKTRLTRLLWRLMNSDQELQWTSRLKHGTSTRMQPAHWPSTTPCDRQQQQPVRLVSYIRINIIWSEWIRVYPVHLSNSHNAPQPKRTKTPWVIVYNIQRWCLSSGSLSVGCSIAVVRLQRISCRQSVYVSAARHTCRRRKTCNVNVPQPWQVDSRPTATAEQDHAMTCKQAPPI